MKIESTENTVQLNSNLQAKYRIERHGQQHPSKGDDVVVRLLIGRPQLEC